MIQRLHNLKLSRPLVVLDTETTGCDPEVDRIVEIACVKFAPDAGPETFRRRLEPGMPIPPEATAIHGITDDDVVGCPSFSQIAARLLRFIDRADLAGFNLKSFDLPFLTAEFARCRLELSLNGRAVLDPLQIFFEHERRDLAGAVAFYCGREHRYAHSALSDAVAAAEVLDAQLGRYELPQTVPELHQHFCPVDVGGKFRREGGRVVFAFGKHAGKGLASVARDDPDYLRWMLSRNFLPDVHALVRRALERFCGSC
jgi:DNA polymerase-3 subunit epsilon